MSKFDGLDPLMRFKLRQYISKEIIDRQVIIIISSHNLRELEDICDSIVMIKENRLQFNHTTDEAKQIYHKYQMVFEENFNVENFSVLNPLNITGKDRIFTVILKGDMSTIDAQIKELNPLIYEHNPVTLEEIFIYEMEGNKNEGTI